MTQPAVKFQIGETLLAIYEELQNKQDHQIIIQANEDGHHSTPEELLHALQRLLAISRAARAGEIIQAKIIAKDKPDE